MMIEPMPSPVSLHVSSISPIIALVVTPPHSDFPQDSKQRVSSRVAIASMVAIVIAFLGAMLQSVGDFLRFCRCVRVFCGG